MMKHKGAALFIGFLVVCVILLSYLRGEDAGTSQLSQIIIWGLSILGAFFALPFLGMALLSLGAYLVTLKVQLVPKPLSEAVAIPENLNNEDNEIRSLGFSLFGTIQWLGKDGTVKRNQWIYLDEAKTTAALMNGFKSQPLISFASIFTDDLELEIVFNYPWAAHAELPDYLLRSIRGSITAAHSYHQQMAHELTLSHGKPKPIESLEETLTKPEKQARLSRTVYMNQIKASLFSTQIGLAFLLPAFLGFIVQSNFGSLAAITAIGIAVIIGVLFVDTEAVKERGLYFDERKRKTAE